MPLVDVFPDVEGEMAVISQEVLVDVSELPNQKQGDDGDDREEQRMPLQGVAEAEGSVEAQRHREGEEVGEGEKVEDLREVETDLVAHPVTHHYPLVQQHEQ